MRDIVGPRHAPEPPAAEVEFVQLVVPEASEPPFLERVANQVNTLGARVANFKLPALSRRKRRVVHRIAEPVATIKPHKAPRGVVTKAVRATRRAAQVTKHELRKPGRKTALVHTVALGALFAIVISGGTPFYKTSNQSSANDGPTTTTRRYLPSVSNNQGLAPLQVGKALLDSGQKLNLYGWITPWNVQSGINDQFNASSAFWLTVDAGATTFSPKADWSLWHTFRDQHTIGESYLTVSGDPNDTSLAMVNTDVQAEHIAGLLRTVQDQRFDGIDIDYEGLGSTNRELFTNFVRNLSTAFHQQGKKVAVTLEARIANQVPMDWHTIGQLADEVRIMAYDYHSRNTGQPGPIAPLAWVAEVASFATSQIPPQKLVMGLGNYGYDWSAPLTALDTWQGTGISFEQATTMSTTQNIPVIRRTGIDERGYDIGTIPTFSYTDSQGRQHQVWFEDAASLQDKLNTISAYNIKGVMFWSVGAGDPSLWQQPTK